MPEAATGLAVAVAIYVVILLTLGVAGRRASAEHTLSDFYLAGRGIGALVLLFTLFATQYSGNSLSGFPGQTYREGLAYYMSVTFMVGIVSGYLLFAPRLFSLSRRRRYVTPTDFLADRFASPVLNYLSAVILAVTLVNYLLAQLLALGHATAGMSDGAVPYRVGVVAGAVVILIYELLGGMRAVAWTDAVQGAVLAGGLLLAVALIVREVGSPATILESIAKVAPEKVAPPTATTCVVWISNFLLLALGAPLYPQAIQRIYAARRLLDLRRALAVMAFLPHVAITTVVFIGVAGIALFPGLTGIEADEITFLVLAELLAREPLAYVPVVAILVAVLAAIMSTADSCLLSLSSIFAKDFFARLRGLSDERAEGLTRMAPLTSILAMVVLVLVALRPPTTLWGLLVIKFEILIQLSPAFVLGTLHEADDPRAFRAADILAGLGAGLAVGLVLYATGARLGGLHAGTAGVVVNYLVAVVCRRRRLRTSPSPSHPRDH